MLQEKSSFSLAVEAGPLLPSTRPRENGVGIEAIAIVSAIIGPVTVHGTVAEGSIEMTDARVRAMSAPARSAPDTKVMNSSVEMREMRDDHSSLRRSDKRREPERAGTSLSDQRSKCHGWSEGMYDDATVLAQAILERHAEAREAARCAALLRQSNKRPKRLKIIGTLYAFGWVVGWVYRGFKPKTTQ